MCKFIKIFLITQTVSDLSYHISFSCFDNSYLSRNQTEYHDKTARIIDLTFLFFMIKRYNGSDYQRFAG